MTSNIVILAQDISKTYHMAEIEVNALRGVSFEIHPGEVVSIMGPSGSGKSTLMNILGCLDRPSSGSYILDGKHVSQLNDYSLASARNRKVGFVFQSFNLLPRSSALMNVELPLRYSGMHNGRRARAEQALCSVGLSDRIQHKPNELSGGQQQRVAIARALVNEPAMILADEPTGNLDSVNGRHVLDLMLELNRREGTTLLLVTHEQELAASADRRNTLHDGRIASDEVRPRD